MIRRRSDADLPGCVGVLEQVHVSDGYPSSWPAVPAAWLSPDGYLTGWVATADENDRAIAGHLCVVHGTAIPEMASLVNVPLDQLAGVSRLFVAGPERGRGVGAMLLAAAQGWASSYGRRLVLEVVESDTSAVVFYERLGWQWVDCRTADWIMATGKRPVLRIYLAPERDHLPNS